MQNSYPDPTPGASLLLAFRLHRRTTLIVGGGPLAASRVFAALEADSEVVVFARENLLCQELKWRAELGQVLVFPLPPLSSTAATGGNGGSSSYDPRNPKTAQGEIEQEENGDLEEKDMNFISEYLSSNSTHNNVSLACITDTIIPTSLSPYPSPSPPAPLFGSPATTTPVGGGANRPRFRRSIKSAQSLYHLFRTFNIPVNTTDLPSLCDFTFLSSHRFVDCPVKSGATGGSTTTATAAGRTALQIGVTTNGKGCKLAGRVLREAVARLPKEVGRAVENLGMMRELARLEDEGEEDLAMALAAIESHANGGEKNEQEEAQKEKEGNGAGDDHAESTFSRPPLFERLTADLDPPSTNVGKAEGRGEFESEVIIDSPSPISSPVTPASPVIPTTTTTTTPPTTSLIPPRPAENSEQRTTRRLKWVSQISEHWPLARLASMSPPEMLAVLASPLAPPRPGSVPPSNTPTASLSPPGHRRSPVSLTPTTVARKTYPTGPTPLYSLHALHLLEKQHKIYEAAAAAASAGGGGAQARGFTSQTPSGGGGGRIIIVGAGPGHPALLTQAARHVLTDVADVVFSDKLVPEGVVGLVREGVEVRIAKKFYGNAEGAQGEIVNGVVEEAGKGKTVVRLKQGDLSVYARTSEEILFYRKHGFEPVLVPGLSSALAGPTMAGIPITQRGVAESFVVCTGAGRGGKKGEVPGYERARTLVVLMGVGRLEGVVRDLIGGGGGGGGGERGGEGIERGDKKSGGRGYPENLPVAIIERASMSDQRVVVSTLRDVVEAMESVGEQRPPGMIVVGWAVAALDMPLVEDRLLGEQRREQEDGEEEKEEEVLSEGAEARDEERVKRWLGGTRWKVREGLDESWEDVFAQSM